MRLFEVYQRMSPKRLDESGSVEGTGPIAQQEIQPTLMALQDSLGLDLSHTLGSAAQNKTGGFGKKAFSGDIDVAVDATDGIIDTLQQSPLISGVAKAGDVVSTKVKIVDYDESLESPDPNRPRTGFVQVDFMLTANTNWAVFFWHSPHEGDSQYKGVYRTVLLSTLASFVDRKQSTETIEDGRHEWVEKWTLSFKGMRRLRITPKMNAKGTAYTKANNQEQIGGWITDPKRVIQVLGLDSIADADSYESLIAAIRKNHSDIYPDIVDSFKQSKSLEPFGGAPGDL